MLKTMKHAFGWAVGYVLGLAAMRFAAEMISGVLDNKKKKDESTDN